MRNPPLVFPRKSRKHRTIFRSDFRKIGSNAGLFFGNRAGTLREALAAEPIFERSPALLTASIAIPARFAVLPATAPLAPRRSGLAGFFLAPFRDVDDRPARKAAAARAEREARQAAMSVVAGPRR
jgi:hypothetical protein